MSAGSIPSLWKTVYNGNETIITSKYIINEDKNMQCPKCRAKTDFQVVVKDGVKYLKCDTCGALLTSDDLRRHTQQPRPQPPKTSNKGVIIAAALSFLILAIFAVTILSLFIPDDGAASEREQAKTQARPKTAAETAADPASETEEEPPAEDESVPKEYRSALNKAMVYSDMMHMSKTGIYDQLTSEYGDKFSMEAAQYATDNMQADWNANALASAKNYVKTMYMSKAGVYDQLISEYGDKFTPEEAQYAIDNLQVDWNACALKKAREYQEMMAMSPEAIRDQLTSEYGEKFTPEEAAYAIQNLN